MSLVVLLTTLAGLLGSCTGNVVTQTPGVDGGACTTPIFISPDAAEAAPYSILRFNADGGTGVYEYDIITSESGGEVNAETGVYLAGPAAGADIIRVRDRGCEGEARAEVTVHPSMEILPPSLVVSPSETVRFQARGGSGEYRFRAVTNGSNGSMSPDGIYVAGPDFGVDVIQVTDDRTGATSESAVSVVADASIAVSVPRVFIPVGSSFDVDVQGAAAAEVTTPSPTLSVEDSRLTAISPGDATVVARDPFTGRETSLRVTSIAASAHEGERREEFSEYTTFSRAVDLNSDGRPEVLFANPFASVGGYRSGGLFMFTAEGGTLAEAPIQVLPGRERNMRFGDAVQLVDLNGDGRPELIVGASEADMTGTNNGAVFFYRINDAGQIEQPPYAELFGSARRDSFGRHLTTCDFNGDGELDLAVGAPSDENGERLPIPYTQGAVHLFLGRGGGEFALSADQILYGEAPTEGEDGEEEWTGVRDARFGSYLAAGDFDGDDLCDLAAYGISPTGDGNHGYVALHRGRAGVERDRGGVEEHAGLRLSGLIEGDLNGRLGRFLAFGDFDGDGKDDLVVTHPHSTVMERADAGSAYIILGRRLSAMPAREDQFPIDLADRTFSDSLASGNMGMGLAVADVNNDDRMDLVLGSPRSRAEMTESGRPGVVRIFLGRDDGLPWSDASREIEGTVNDARYGYGVRVVDQLIGSRSLDIMAVSGYSNLQGWRVPAPTVSEIDDAAPGTPLEVPGSAAGSLLGQGVALPGDLNGDGFIDMVATVPNEARVAWNGRRGGVHLFLGTASGFESSPAMAFVGFPNHGGIFGEAITAAGDVNGDGVADFAVLSPYTQTPSNITDTSLYVVADTCSPGAGRSVVSVFLGSSSGLPSTQPAFMFVGPRTENGVGRHIAGGHDIDGDDLDDILLSSPDWRLTTPPPMGSMEPASIQYGGFALFRGNYPDDRGRIVIFCEPSFVGMGPTEDTNFGSSIVGIGDLNGDGCDEFAIGDTGFELDEDSRNSGQVTIYTGFDGVRCTNPAPDSIRLTHRQTNAGAGNDLASGTDIDGDLLPDLLVGARQFRDSAGERGRVYLVRSAYLRSLLMAGEDGALVDPDDTGVLSLIGQRAGERFGYSLALLSDLGVVDGPGLAIAAPLGSYSGRTRTGSVLFFSFGAEGISPEPVALIAGDASAEESLMGFDIQVNVEGVRPLIAVGAPWSSASAGDLGAAYGMQLTP